MFHAKTNNLSKTRSNEAGLSPALGLNNPGTLPHYSPHQLESKYNLYVIFNPLSKNFHDTFVHQSS